jgi:hypothetical protein
MMLSGTQERLGSGIVFGLSFETLSISQAGR